MSILEGTGRGRLATPATDQEVSMNIGLASDRSGVPAKTIRYYEAIGLIPPADRTGGNYRDYDDSAVRILQFLKRARAFGFTIDDCRELMSLYRDRNRSSADVKAIAQHRVAEIEAKIVELKALRDTLGHLVERCHGDERPDCPILDDLAR
jgi:MerR family transcriptional regulator, copper efflux regulator